MGKFFGNIIIMTLLLVGIVISVTTLIQFYNSIPEENSTMGIVFNILEENKNKSKVDIIYLVDGAEYTTRETIKKEVSVGDDLEVYYKVKAPEKASLEQSAIPGILQWIITIVTLFGSPFLIHFIYNIDISWIIDFILDFITEFT